MASSLTLKEISSKLRMVKPKPPGDNGISTVAYQTTRVTAQENGINLNRSDGGLIQYSDISLMVTFQLDADPDTWYVDLFVYATPGAFRISQKTVNYRQFLPEVSQRSKDNFSAFLLHLINQNDSVYLDDQTLEFLKTQKIQSFPDFKLVEDYTRQLWFQVINWMKFACDQCGEIYWVDDAKISEQGAKTKCVKCQNIVTVKKREKPAPLKTKSERKKNPCPHCQYENVEGAQFCVMCQKPLTELKAKPTLPEKESTQADRTPAQQASTAKPELQPILKDEEERREISGLPLQARGQWKTRRSFQEIVTDLHDHSQTLSNKFAGFARFSLIMQIVGYAFFVGGILYGTYLIFAAPNPEPPALFPMQQRLMYAGVSTGVGFLFFLASLITSNIIALTLEIERNTKITTILLHKLVEQGDE